MENCSKEAFHSPNHGNNDKKDESGYGKGPKNAIP